jgi:UDP-N-acetyl-D-mannosaminuronate dehydrogenase
MPNISKALVIGVSFKRNCPTILFSAPISFGKQLEKLGVEVDYMDDIADME